MSRHWRFGLMVSLVLTALMAPQLPAPIFGFFPGMAEMIERSDAIVVVEITATPQERRMRETGTYDPILGTSLGLHEDYEVRVLRSIKGDFEVGQECVLGRRNLPFLSASWDGPSEDRERQSFWEVEDLVGFRTGSWHLLFLQREPSFSPYVPFGEPAVAFSLNCEGGHFPLATGTNLFPDLVAAPEVVIEQVVRDSTPRHEDEETRAVAERLADLLLGVRPPALPCTTCPVREESPSP